jgi:hypothetical protein
MSHEAEAGGLLASHAGLPHVLPSPFWEITWANALRTFLHIPQGIQEVLIRISLSHGTNTPALPHFGQWGGKANII